MRFSHIATYLAVGSNLAQSASLPDSNALSIAYTDANVPRSDIVAPENALEKRKGGGGGGGGKGGGGGSSSSSSGSSGSSGARAGGINGGSTRAGSGAPRAYAGYYGGGAAVPYKAGEKGRKGLAAGGVLGAGAAVAIMPGVWLAGVYPYYYHNPYRFYNHTRRNSTNNQNKARFAERLFIRQNQDGQEESLPVICLCAENAPCGCEENDDQKYLDQLIGNGSWAALNHSLVNVGDVNGARTLTLNGTLPEGTTAPGGEDAAAASLRPFGTYSGYWAMALIVAATVSTL